ncbi:hypothetical protein R5R35_001581 [Gryllus longicercus]|uniref:UPF0547 domain-containing protein n=1 Tax=Gryllus longicercus TaxID=2509291 RepID=A0AAN9ZID5_9ORTH|nr:Uncharacterized protein GBIM_17234 [Gryllus bimaculatus]
MPKHKMITKSCPKCGLQMPVACKTCPCGHAFITGRRSGSSSDKDEGIPKRRRTERVKREKPNYYDSLEYDKQMKKLQKKRNRSSTEEHTEQADDDRHRLKKKRKRSVKSDREPEEDNIMSNLSPEKGYKCSLILSEINRKMCVTSWRV